MYIENMFATPILKFHIDEKIADRVEQIFVKKLDNLTKEKDQYSDFHESVKIIDLKKEFPALTRDIEMAKKFYMESSGLDANEDDIDYWFQDYRDEGQHHKIHNHGIYGISGVYWIRANRSAGDFIIHNNNPIIEYTKWTHYTPYNKPNFTIKPQKGLMILFPSFMNHEVLPSGPDAVRSTLAFNFPLNQIYLKHGEPEEDEL